MSYSDFYLKSRSKTPFFLYVLAFIAVGGFAAVFLQPSTPSVKASKENVVYHTLANLSSHQAAVYYQTTNSTPSWVIYGTNPASLDKAAFDDRDSSDHKTGYYLHYVILKDLQQDTSYSYKIIADGEVVSVNSVDTFTFRTPPPLAVTTDSSINPAYGKVIEKNNQQVDNGFIIYYYPNAYPLVSPINGGDWLISLTSLIDRNTNKPIQPQSSQTVKLEIINEELKSTSIETVLGNTTPLSKTVIIGTPFSEDKTENVLGAHIQVPNAPSPAPTKAIASSALLSSGNSGVNIVFPKEKAIIPGNQPLIKGTATPSSKVLVTLRTAGQTILSTKLTTTSEGDWKLSLPMVLKAATYSLTAIPVNGLSSQAVSRTFSTTKSGEVVLGTATGSATLTPTSSQIPTAAPTVPTTVALSPTAQPTYAVVTTTPPVTGHNNSAIMLGSLFLVLIAGGIILFI